MSNIACLFILLFLFLLMSLPIGVSLGLSTIITLWCYTTTPMYIVIQNIFSGLNSFSLMAIPFFMLAGNLMGLGGISRRIVNFCDALIGAVTGGLGHVAIAASMIFAAISGSAPATVSAIGTMMIPDMEKNGYDKDYATALCASAGTIGVIIPPSIPFVIYCVVAGESVGTLFIAGIVPGILIGAGLMLVNFLVSKKYGYKGVAKSKRPKLWATFKDSFLALLTPVIILGGIYAGIFTPTESAVVAVFYSLLVGTLVYKELDLKTIFESLRSTAELNGSANLAVGLSMAFSAYLTMAQIPATIGDFITSNISSGTFIILFMLVILLIVGLFVDNISACLVLTPIFLPIVTSIGYDPIHFGVIMTVALAIGFCTPPFGSNLFVASSITGLRIEAICKRIIPFILSMIICLLLITFIPAISMTLVKFMA
ncbi:MAG: C4-dicarboxylate ABC transporter permease [Bacillota bacterium]|nr:MAG: C4-dicarboxylate ABC transporter permease [Bacillota bacterium]